MNGSSHQKIAILSYAIVATVPAINSFQLFNNDLIHVSKGISLVGLGLAGLAGLAVDADTQHSKFSHMVPVKGIVNEAVDIVEKLLKIFLRLLLGVGLGLLILMYSNDIINQLSTIEKLKPYASMITYLIAGLLIFSGIANETIFKNLPVIGFIYKKLLKNITVAANSIKRISMLVFYGGSGFALIVYNILNLNDIYLYVIATLLISIAIFPHRSFLHSIEGTVVFTISVSYILNKFGYKDLTGAFFIGYISHIYWADIFTKEGVPLLSTPRILARLLKKMHIHNEFEKTLKKIGNIKLKLPPHISTGSVKGNLFEMIYIWGLFIIAVISYIKFGTGITVF